MTKTALATRIVAVFMTLAASLGAVLSSSSAMAATSTTQGFQISPPVVDLSLDPGTSTKQTIKITNLTDQQITLAVGKTNFVAKGEEGEVELVDGGDPLYSLINFFQPQESSVVVPPRGTSSVTYTLAVPVGAEPGGRYGSITFTAAPGALAPGQSGASVRQQLAALIFLRINGAAKEQLKIASLAPSKTLGEYGPVNLVTRVQNLGTVHEKPTGQIVVKNMFGWTTKTIKLDEQHVIPGAIRKLTNTLDRHWLFGRYTATVTLHNGTQQTLTAKTHFTIIPYKIIAIILIALILIIGIGRRGRKRFGRAIRILAGRE